MTKRETNAQVSVRRRSPVAMAGLVAAIGLSSACARSGTPVDAAVVDLAITGVALVDVEAGRVLPNRTILIAGGRIAAVEARGTAVPRAARVVDGAGRFAIPGLWDMHVHALWDRDVTEAFLPAFVRHGVVGVRDMGGDLGVLRWAREEAPLRPQWPRIVAAGAILDGPEPVDPSISIAVATPADAERAVATVAEAGADFVKVYTLLPADAFRAVADAARARGLEVVGHVPASVGPKAAVAAGQRGIEHLADELGGLCPSGDDAEAAARDCDALIASFAAAGTRHTPTLAVLEAKGRPGYRSDGEGDTAAWPDVVEGFWRASAEQQRARPASYFAGRATLFAHELDLVGRLSRASVPVLAGSDTGNPYIAPGTSLHRELELLVAAGLTPAQALAAATVAPARVLGRDGAGHLRPGSVADIVLLGTDPLEDISAVRGVEAVVLRGEVVVP